MDAKKRQHEASRLCKDTEGSRVKKKFWNQENDIRDSEDIGRKLQVSRLMHIAIEEPNLELVNFEHANFQTKWQAVASFVPLGDGATEGISPHPCMNNWVYMGKLYLMKRL